MLLSRVTLEKAFGTKLLLIVKVCVFLLLLAALPHVSQSSVVMNPVTMCLRE